MLFMLLNFILRKPLKLIKKIYLSEAGWRTDSRLRAVFLTAFFSRKNSRL